MRLALTDDGGDLAQAALDALTPDKLECVALPSLVASLRAILASAPATSAVDKLTDFVGRVEAGAPRSTVELSSFD